MSLALIISCSSVTEFPEWLISQEFPSVARVEAVLLISIEI